ncbi:MAG: hypothetical protein AAF411_07760 [Myxococcota bacterium]
MRACIAAALFLSACFTDFDPCAIPGRCEDEVGVDAPFDAQPDMPLDAPPDTPLDAPADTPLALDTAASSECNADAGLSACVDGESAGRCVGDQCCTGCVGGLSASSRVCLPGTSDAACGTNGTACGACGGLTPVCRDGACGVRIPVREVSAGEDDTCALAVDGRLHCWGSTGTGDADLGNAVVCPDCEDGSCGESPCCARRPVLANESRVGTFRFNTLELGRGSAPAACALTAEDQLFCWGDNHRVRASGGDPARSFCAPSMLDVGERYDAISVGANGTCALRDGQLFCWGRNNRFNELGPSDPLLAATPIAGASNVAQVSHANDHTCILINGDGVRCVGQNSDGRLGSACGSSCNSFQAVAGTTGFVAIDTGENFTCGLEARDAPGLNLYCWGNGENGRLGVGDAEPRFAPTPVGTSIAWDSISLGRDHACGLTVDGTAYCWGSGRSGRLGTGTADDANVPTPVLSDLRFAGITAGGKHTCAWTTEGALYCWGDAEFRQLGRSSSDDSFTPIQLDLGE